MRELVIMADGKNLSAYSQLAYLAMVIVNMHSTQSATIDELMAYKSIYEREQNNAQTANNSAVAALAANAENLGLQVVNKRIDET